MKGIRASVCVQTGLMQSGIAKCKNSTMAKKERNVDGERVVVEVVGSVKLDGSVVPSGERVVLRAEEAVRLIASGHVRGVYDGEDAAGVGGEEGAGAG